MKRMISIITVFCLLASVAALPAFAADNTVDSLITLSYLNNILKPRLVQSVRQSAISTPLTPASQRYKRGDVLQGSVGSELLVLAGDVSFQGGTAIDTTAGTELNNGGALSVRHRYITAEDGAVYTVASPTAVISCNGNVRVTQSDAPQYEVMAQGLHTINLLRGTGVGYGAGYDLEKQPTRIEALVMFIRLLGEEDDALQSEAAQRFTDIPNWADRYAAYAYEKGYTTGVGNGQFAPHRNITPQEYVEFLLRAMGHSSFRHTDLRATLPNAVSSGVLNNSEVNALADETFLRAHIVYISYYALFAPMAKGDISLGDTLVNKGICSAEDLSAIQRNVTSNRIQP